MLEINFLYRAKSPILLSNESFSPEKPHSEAFLKPHYSPVISAIAQQP